jgi:anti-sigma factor RsiW
MRFAGRFRRDIDCRHAVELMSEYIDGHLAARDRDRLERHLEDCPHCVEYLAQLRVTVDATGRVEADVLSEDALDELVEVYRRWTGSME